MPQPTPAKSWLDQIMRRAERIATQVRDEEIAAINARQAAAAASTKEKAGKDEAP